MRAVVDASPLIYLTKIGRLDVLYQYDEVLVPPEVLAEIERGLAAGHPEVLEVRRLVETGRLRVRRAGKPRAEWNLDPGEVAVLALARRAKVDEVIVDDRAAIGVAKYFGLRPVSVPFLLLRERRAGRLSQTEFEGALRRLLGVGYYLSAELHSRLIAAGRG